ncbi:MAG: ribosome maturation factor RimP [Eubacteriales bacterium]|nr:ribosome maturation factor RimP [Eubacteriales bacterium]
MKKNIVEIVEQMLEPIMEENKYELVDVEYLKENGQWYLRVYADKENGITIDDCEIISRALEVKLDAEDPIDEAYILEVSSPGLDRVLKKDKDFQRYMGYSVDVKLYKAINKQKEFTGILEAFNDENITIDVDGQEMVFERSKIAMVRLTVFI